MGRPREFDEAEALEAATQVFWTQGFEATSLHDLLKAMNLSKSSFYQTFESKESLFQRCLGHYADVIVASMDTALDSSSSGKAFIERILMGVAEETRGGSSRRGCLVMNTANELGQRDPDLGKIIARNARRFEEVFSRALQRAMQEGEVDPARPLRATARYLVCTLSGLKTMVKAGAGPKAVTEIAQVALRSL